MQNRFLPPGARFSVAGFYEYSDMESKAQPMEPYEKIEQSILKKYRKQIWYRFIGAMKDYRLVQAGDRIAVCISGGKDSMLLAKCLQLLQRHSEVPYELEFLAMDPGYSAGNRKLILSNAEKLNIPLNLFETRIFEIVVKSGGTPCYLCARMRRGYLYAYAKKLGCNKIALGHHFDDMIETALMSMLYAAEIRTMMPKLHSAHFPGMEIIRPLYLVREADILAWKRYNNLQFLRCACLLTEKLETDSRVSKRAQTKKLIAELRRENPQIDVNIFRSMHNVNLDTVIGYRQNGVKHSFLDRYDESGKKP